MNKQHIGIGTLVGYLFLSSTSVFALAEHTYYVHQDHLGSVVAMTDETGNIVKQTKYLPYGEEDVVEGSLGNKVERSYTGQIKDQDTSLYYYNARYYDPVLSRFISADSVNDNVNRYAYVGGNPINLSDPTGNMEWDGGGGGVTKKKRETSRKPYTPTFNQPPPINPASDTWYSYDETADANYMGTAPGNPQGLALFLAGGAGVACAFGQVYACAGINLLLGAAITEHVASGGQSTTLTTPALVASSVATVGYPVVQAAPPVYYRAKDYLFGKDYSFPKPDPTLRTLDVGSGIGDSSRVPRSIRLDIDYEVRPDVVADARRLPFKSGSFDIVTADYLPLENNALANGGFDRIGSELARVVDPKGLISIQTTDLLYSEAVVGPINPIAFWDSSLALQGFYRSATSTFANGSVTVPEFSTYPVTANILYYLSPGPY